jgi:hypothetical protein
MGLEGRTPSSLMGLVQLPGGNGSSTRKADVSTLPVRN